MKKFLALAILLFCAAILFAQVPEKFSYQAVVRNDSSRLVCDRPVGVQASILNDAGEVLYRERHVEETNENGLLTVEIGSGNVMEGSFSNIPWGTESVFLRTEIDPAGGENYVLSIMQRLVSVPYALYAKEAANGFSGDYNDLTNTPVIPTMVGELANDANYITLDQVPAQVNADWNATGGVAQILNKPNLAMVATTGDYNDLTNRPNLAPVATSGNYNDLTNKPLIPTAVGELTNNVGYITLSQVPAQVNADWNATAGAAQILNKPNLAPVATSGNYNDLTNKPELFSGDYNDLTNKPTIPTVPTNVSAFVNDAGYLTAIPDSFGGISIESDPVFSAWDKDYNDLTNKPDLFSGDYNDLTNKPAIPTVPTNVSAFANDAGYLTAYTEIQTLADVTAQGNSAGNRQLKNVSDPTEPQDAVTKSYLDQLVSNLTGLIQDLQQQLDSLQNVVNALTGGGAVIDEKSCPGTPTVTDHEGNVYATVQIGEQCWMRDNLRTTTSPSTGTYLIPVVDADYTYTGKQARWYNNDSATYAPMNFGLLYNWNAAVDTFNTAYGETSVNNSSSNALSVSFPGNRRGVCPAGWHLPSDAEWSQLTDYVGSQSEYTCGSDNTNIAKALASTTGWNTSTSSCGVGNNQSANNATDFSVVPAGNSDGSSFSDAGNFANFWSSTGLSYFAYYRYLYYRYANVSRYNLNKSNGISVRCLRD